MQDPVNKGKWIEGFFKHFDSCYALGTFGCPHLPPHGATILPAVVILKMVINTLKQVNAHKVRVCCHGGHQQRGCDFDESFANTVLCRSLKIGVTLSLIHI